MKNRLLAVFMITVLSAAMMAGCGKKDTPVEEVPEPTTEASTEEVSVEAPAPEPSDAATEGRGPYPYGQGRA